MTHAHPHGEQRHGGDPASAPGERFLALGRQPRAELERALQRGHTPDPAQLVGWEFRGLNTPAWAGWAGIRKFLKGFYDPTGPGAGVADAARAWAPREIWGYNCPVVQNRLEEPWVARPDHDRPRRFGYYRVTAVDPTARDNAYLHAVLLDYGAGGHVRLDPARGLRDYLVQVDPASPDLYLGKAYYALGPVRVGVSFFVLERYRRAPGDPAQQAPRAAQSRAAGRS